MSISLVQSKKVVGEVSPVLAFDSPNTAGNLLIAFVRLSVVAPQTFTYSDSQGNVAEARAAQYDATASIATQVFIVRNCKGGANSVTVDPISVNGQLAIHEFSGVNTVDQSALASGTGLSQDSGPVTTNYADELLFGYEAAGIQATVTGDPAWTTAEFYNTTFLTQYKVVSAIGTYNSTTTATAGKSGVVNWDEEIITFYKASTEFTQIMEF